MTYQIDIQTEVELPSRMDSVLKRAVLLALGKQAVLSGSLTLLLTNDTRMRELNQGFRGIDQTTDVLSFPAGDSLPEKGEAIPYLGDIALSVPVASNQAEANGHSLAAELQLLAVHGVLHLLGYDHSVAGEKAHMWAAQNEILNHLGLRDIVPTEI